MNIRFLETVLWLAQLRTIKATADRLCITHTAISSRIASIEQDLGVSLFTRSAQGFEPTADGLRFIEEASKIVDAYQRLRRVMLDPGRVRGTLRIGSVSTLIPTVFSILGKTLREEYPHVSLVISTDLPERLLKDFRGGRLDLLLTSSWPDDPHFDVVPLCKVAMGWVASEQLGIDTHRPLTPDQLAAYPIIGYPAGTESQMRIDAYFSGIGRELVLHAGNGLPSNLQMAKSCIGIAAVPKVAARGDLNRGDLVLVPTTQPYPDVGYAALFLRDGDNDLPRAIAALARQAAAQFCEASDPSDAWPMDASDNPEQA
ncbi:HTH-type transcriptional regulator GltC (plasmid) [Variovorax sp. SRS16]|uniref:LysR family transcriptional regulator n=1 Tax=Variovorax sp. SRS16 TaxID=282217 RepID=UPI001317C8B4|nr:LysR family transcriptional regulator [Variovorax sp. SRS16]VTU46751.1 HTH-type transcriptional regulator GltC [Variovorax sp. SRS16]